MGKFTEVLKSSLQLLIKEPKLFLPKILIAALYGISMLWTAQLYLDTIALQASAATPSILPHLTELFSSLVLAFVYFILVMIVDILVNAMYPTMVADYRKGTSINFTDSFKSALKKGKVVIPAVLITTALFILLTLPLNFLSNLAQSAGNQELAFIYWTANILIIFTLTVLFYLLYPVSVLEAGGIIKTIKRTFSLSRKNARDITKASLIPFGISLLNFALAFLASNPAALLAFIILRFLVAVMYTYHMVLNPAIYLEYAIGTEKQQ